MQFTLVRDFAKRVVWVHERIGYIESFLSRNDIVFLTRELEFVYWQPSQTYEALPDGTRRILVNSFRTSESGFYHWFTPSLLDFLANLDQQISTSFGFSPECLEPWQATRYKPGGSFEYHRDSGYWSDHPAGERIVTFLLHLVAAESGGSTSFRALNVDVPAAPGRLVFWLNLRDNGRADHSMIHSGTPVDKGTKVTFVSWQRERPFARE